MAQERSSLTGTSTGLDDVVAITIEIDGAKLVPVEEPFYPDEKLREASGGVEHVLPENVFAAAIACTLQEDNLGEVAGVLILVLGPPVLITLYGQTVLVYYLLLGVLDADGDLEHGCAPGLFPLQSVALMAFVCYAMRDLVNALDVHLWLSMFKTSAAFERLKLQKYQGRADKRTHHRPTNGIPVWLRVAFYAFFVAPHVAITVAVLISGAGAILRSENRFDLVLNCVAAVFVLELDDAAYALFVSRDVKKSCVGMPPLNDPDPDKLSGIKACSRVSGGLFLFWVLFGSACLICWPLYMGWCGT